MRLAADKQAEYARELVWRLGFVIGEELAQAILNADQKTGSATMFWKFASPAHTGVPTPSHLKKAAVNVSTAGTRMMQTLMSSAGSANSHIARQAVRGGKGGTLPSFDSWLNRVCSRVR